MAQAQRVAERDLLFEARVLAHIKETDQPETLAGLAKTPALKAQPFTIIREFHLRPEKRPARAEAPCPLCSPNAPKYFHGALVWFPLEGVYRCIGWECASRFIGKAEHARAKREYKETQTRNADFEFLFANLGLVPQMIRHFEALLPIALHAEKLRYKLALTHVREPLRKACKSGDGQLVVWETKEVERFDPSINAERIFRERTSFSFGRLTGMAAIDSAFDIPRKIRIETALLKVLDHGEQDAAEEWVNDHAYQHATNMRVACQKLRSVCALQIRAIEKIKGVLAFFTQENFDRISKFGQDHRNSITVYAFVRNGEFRIGQSMSECTSIRPNFTILDALPVWPELRLPS